MRQELDEENDIMRCFMSDEPVVETKDFMDGEIRHVHRIDAEGKLVSTEVYGWSKLLDRTAKTVRSSHAAEPETSVVIGHVEWEISDGRTSEILSKGISAPLLSSVKIDVIERPDTRIESVSFPLTDHFTLGIAGRSSPKAPPVGFALQGSRDEVRTFCWDWFAVDRPNHARKIQEGGELGVSVVERNNEWQIVRTEFLTDISIRLARFMVDKPGDPPAWRVRVSAGSWVNWPSLVDGKVVGN